MKILLTGASSFTGFWFAKALHEAGHEVIAPVRGSSIEDYLEGSRAARIRALGQYATIAWNASFGDERFLALIDQNRFDVLCHHAAQVGDYRSPDFDVAAALAANTNALPRVLKSLQENGTSHVVLTGSVFEQQEGAGESPLKAFSPYGLSKGLTAQVFSHWCTELGIPLGKFVIPNPFGPHEEPRFCAYLVRTWQAGATAVVRTPSYVRDNIHVDLLASAYAKFAASANETLPFRRLNPSGYVETQGAFALRFASEMRSRLNLACSVELAKQTDFSEPLMRINTDSASSYLNGWNEQTSWDALGEFYSHTIAAKN